MSTAPRAASTRDVWPEPIPISRPSRTSTIAFDVDAADEPPGEVEVEIAPRRSAPARGHGPGRRIVGERVRGRHQDRAARRPDRAGRLGRGSRLVEGEHRVDDQAQVRLGREDRQGRLVERGRDDDLEEDRDERLGDGAIDRPGQRDDAAERRDRIACERRRPRPRAASAARRRRTGWCA